MTLREKQSRFTWMVGELIAYANTLGYELTFGHAMRCPDCPTGHVKSLHKERLAIDLNLFIDGEYQVGTRGHDVLHNYWENVLGGSPMIPGDANHYSLEHGGMR